MMFLNFELPRPAHARSILALGREWDLHGTAQFEGFSFSPDRDQLELRWRALENPDPGRPGSDAWGGLGNFAPRCGIRFTEVESVLMRFFGERRQQSDTSLHGISKVKPGQGQLGFRSTWEPDEDFNVVIELTGGRWIEVAAKTAEFFAD